EKAAEEELDKALAEKARADQEAAVAKAVNEFLQELLGQADIGKQIGAGQRNPNITVRELLDRAAKDIDTKFKGQELTEAAIRRTLGDAYRALGDFPEAEKHLERSLATRLTALDADHPKALLSMNHLATLYRDRSRYDEAEALFKQALEGYRARLGADDLGTLNCMFNLGENYGYREQFAEAEPLLKEALEGRRAKLGPDHPDTLTSMNALGLVY